MKGHPTCHIVAGPNGAGKTTFALNYLPVVAHCRTFINADLLARGLSPLNLETAAVDAGRLFLRQFHLAVESRQTFAFETTLSGRSYLRHFAAMKAAGYRLHLYYLWIPTVQLTLKRIAERVRRGGHHIPDDIARRRFSKSVTNLFRFYAPLLDHLAIFDNSTSPPRLVYERTNGSQHLIDPETIRHIQEQAGAKS